MKPTAHTRLNWERMQVKKLRVVCQPFGTITLWTIYLLLVKIIQQLCLLWVACLDSWIIEGTVRKPVDTWRQRSWSMLRYSLVIGIQKKEFSTVLQQTKNVCYYLSKLKTLNPFLDSKGVVRVGWLLGNSDFDFIKKHQALLPKCRKLTSIIVEYVLKNIYILVIFIIKSCSRKILAYKMTWNLQKNSL